jgi:4-hydroxybenzoate polyprenyltransferase
LIKEVALYAAFAFVTTFVREVIKDAEDLEGDLDSYCRTIPFLMGTRRTKTLLLALLGLVILTLGYIQYFQIMGGDWKNSGYVGLCVQIPCILTAFYISKAISKEGFAKASLWLKLTMLGGIMSMPAFFFIYNYA